MRALRATVSRPARAGAVAAQFDLAVPLIIALVAFVAAKRGLAGRSSARYGIAWLPAMYIAWALTIVFAKAALHVQGSPGRFLATLVFFRTGGTPLPGLGAGPLLLTVSLTIVVMPLLVGLSRGMHAGRRLWLIPVCLLVVALIYRSICTATDRTSLFGPLSWLPNHLDLVGLGLALALVDNTISDVGVRKRLRLGGLVVAVVAFVVAAFGLGLPRSPLITSAVDVHLYGLVALIFAGGALCAACLVPPVFVHRATPRLARIAAISGPGLLLAGEPAFTLVARQYHERVVEFDGGVFLRGNIVAPFVWSLLVASAFGVVDRRRSRRGRPGPASTVGCDRAVAVGPSRRRGHGVLRPRHDVADDRAGAHRRRGSALLPHHREHARPWAGLPRAAQLDRLRRRIPSAFHGPLYPMVLSISSRFGGTSVLRPQDDVDPDRHRRGVG